MRCDVAQSKDGDAFAINREIVWTIPFRVSFPLGLAAHMYIYMCVYLDLFSFFNLLIFDIYSY